MTISKEHLITVPNTSSEITCPFCGRRDEARHFFLTPVQESVAWRLYEVYCCQPQRPFYLRTKTFIGG